ncbi:MAG: hypothetical protein KDJ38_09470 [Gammaproteobacteria bacterium]|nr:hypothetical protein [Gammaproteobacteria bacterium]
MKKSHGKYSLVSIILASLLAGCATIIGSPQQLLPINSEPAGAKISIVDEKGTTIFEGTTPTTVNLAKSDGSYFGGKEYTVKLEKDGFTSQDIVVNSHVNGWYIGGNLLFGGLIGWLIVDPLNGDMYTLSPKAINESMNSNATSSSGDSLSIVSLEQVPADLQEKMQSVK